MNDPLLSPNPWEENEFYPVGDWQDEVRNNDTRLGYLDWVQHRKEAEEGICCRCDEEVPVFPAPCDEKPELLLHTAIGMYHCPDCGAMVLAGSPHPDLCKRCIDHNHPAFDRPWRAAEETDHEE